MISEVKLSIKLSKRYKRDLAFQDLMNSKKCLFIALENGIVQQSCVNDDGSLFSKKNSKDTEEEIKLLNNVHKRKNMAAIDRYKYRCFLKH